MGTKLNIPDKVQIRLTSSAESILASLEPYSRWIEQTLDAPLSETLTLEVDCNPKTNKTKDEAILFSHCEGNHFEDAAEENPRDRLQDLRLP